MEKTVRQRSSDTFHTRRGRQARLPAKMETRFANALDGSA
jgi:hypothetical protein